MSDKKFSKPVTVKIGNLVSRIGSAWEALEFLSSNWPSDKCASYRRAIAACRDALDGWISTSKAQAAFTEAVKSAGLLTKNRKLLSDIG